MLVEEKAPKVENLLVGMSVKNYKKMCELLDEKVMEGNSKKAQIKNWGRYFDYEKCGQKYIITDIFDEPYPSLDARKNKEGIYVKYIELLLMEYLTKQKGKTAILTKSKLYELVGMTSPKYNEGKHNRGTVINNLKDIKFSDKGRIVDKDDVRKFYARAEHKLNSILNSALRSMANRFLITYSTEYAICCSEENGNFNVRSATELEVKQILLAQKIILEELNLDTFSQVVANGAVDIYFDFLNQKVNELYGWDYVYSQIKIIYLEDYIKKQIPIRAEEIIKLSEYEKKKELNQKVIYALDKQADERYDKTMADIQKKLSDYLMKIN